MIEPEVVVLAGGTGGAKLARGMADALGEPERLAVIVKSGIMSLGGSLLAALVKKAAKALPAFDIEIVEMHHRK